MFGPRLTRIFSSRWMALWWAASMLLLVWQLVPSADDGDAEPDVKATATAQANPWALSASGPTGRR